MTISPYPPIPVRYPLMIQNWESLTFFHWKYAASVIRKMIPSGLEVDTFDGSAWVSLAPFLITGTRVPFSPPLPWISRFPETNVRTYVVGPGGHHGVWFFSLDAARLAAVAGARAAYRLPYMWAKMNVGRQGHQVRYTATRRFPGAPAEYSITLTPGERFEPEELGDLDHFLTARYRLYSVLAGRLAFAQIEHYPWPLARARLESLRQTIVQAAGLPAPAGDPLIHYSEFIPVRIGRPQFVQQHPVTVT
jgi:uncharacterized protein YqjF (DUF2071 family)